MESVWEDAPVYGAAYEEVAEWPVMDYAPEAYAWARLQGRLYLMIPATLLVAVLLASFLYLVSGSIQDPLAGRAASVAVVVQAAVAADVPAALNADVPAIEPVAGECLINCGFPAEILQWNGLIHQYAQERGLPPNLIAALILVESAGNASAYSHSGAVGLMQVMPRDGLASNFMCRSGPCFSDRPAMDELYDPEFNIAYGTGMLADLLAHYGDLREALKNYGPMDVGYSYADKVLGLFEQYNQ